MIEAPTSKADLTRAIRDGTVTLVLGAGVSFSRGVPMWDEVVDRLWERVVGHSDRRDERRRTLQQIRSMVSERLGPEVAAQVQLRSHPLEPQLALEWVETCLSDASTRARVLRALDQRARSRGYGQGAEALLSRSANTCDGRDLFAALLREAMYERAAHDSAESGDVLGTVAGVVRRQYASAGRRLQRIITFNADDLLEQAVGLHDDVPMVWPIVRASDHLPLQSVGGGHRATPVPIYHLHGFLPQQLSRFREAADMLVFTDAQFWECTANPLSFANRVMANALHDSHCVFLGLSMRDVNLMRWLGVRFNEVVFDKHEQYRRAGITDSPYDAALKSLNRHFWIHAEDDDPTKVLGSVLRRRGVRSVSISGWDKPDFKQLLEAMLDSAGSNSATAPDPARSSWTPRL